MSFRFAQLFNIGLTTSYYVDNLPHEDFEIEPTMFCKQQMRRFNILSRKSFDGIMLFYECSPSTNDATPFKPIAQEEKFTFKVTVKNPDFWFYADVKNWEQDKIYFLKNLNYNSTGNINILSGALISPILFRPMEFKQEVTLDTVSGLLEVRDIAGTLINSIIVRSKTSTEPAGIKEQYTIDLKNYKEGIYKIRHINSGGNIDVEVYCSVDYSPGTLAIIEITYKTGVAYTGIFPFQKYIINVSTRLSDWIFDVHIQKKPVPLVRASDLSINHLNIPPEPLQTFTPVPDDVNGIVLFTSNAKLSFSQRPIHLQLINTVTNKPVLDQMPLPSSIDVQQNGTNLETRVIVNI